jgi:hypothetical protein
MLRLYEGLIFTNRCIRRLSNVVHRPIHKSARTSFEIVC